MGEKEKIFRISSSPYFIYPSFTMFSHFFFLFFLGVVTVALVASTGTPNYVPIVGGQRKRFLPLSQSSCFNHFTQRIHS